MGLTTCLGLILTLLVISPCVYGQASCDLERTNDCIEELESILNDTKGEGRTNADKVRMCTLSLRDNNNISTCVRVSKALCDDASPALQEANRRWENVKALVHEFCDNDCRDYTLIKDCKEKVNLTAIDQGVPSAYCKTYKESRQCLEDEIDEFGCSYKGDIYDALFDGSYFRNYYQNVCLADCSNLDETVNILKTCFPIVQNPDPTNTCLAHWNFTTCLNQSYPIEPCRQFPSLIPILYRYDYLGNQRLCQDEACLTARTCQSQIQRQYDATLGYYIVQSNDTTHLKDLCLVTMRENEHISCYNRSIMDCTSAPNHPLKAQWNELVRDITQLCNTDCEGVMENIPRCQEHIQYDHFYSNRWSDFCRSHSNATECVGGLNCELATSMFDTLINTETVSLINNVCTSGCSNLHDVLGTIERCFPSMNKTSSGCSHYDAFKTCMNRHTSNVCKEADDILDFLFPGYTGLSIRCTTTTTIYIMENPEKLSRTRNQITTSASNSVASQFLWLLSLLMTSYQLTSWS